MEGTRDTGYLCISLKDSTSGFLCGFPDIMSSVLQDTQLKSLSDCKVLKTVDLYSQCSHVETRSDIPTVITYFYNQHLKYNFLWTSLTKFLARQRCFRSWLTLFIGKHGRKEEKVICLSDAVCCFLPDIIQSPG